MIKQVGDPAIFSSHAEMDAGADTDMEAGAVAFETQQQLLTALEKTNQQLRCINQSLQVSESKLAVTLNSIGDAVIATDSEARVTLMNPHAEQLTGWTQEQAIGRPVEEIFHIINQETRLASTIPVMETLAHGTVHGLANHTLMIARDGGERAIADSCAPIRDSDGRVAGAVLVFRDVTEEYAAQKALHETEEQLRWTEESFRLMVESVTDCSIVMLDSAGLVVSWNSGAQRIKGYTAEEILGRDFSMFYPPEELSEDFPRRALDAAANSGRFEHESWRLRKDGSRFWANEVFTAIRDQDGNLRGFAKLTRDLTEPKRQAQVLHDKNAELEKAKSTAEKANRAKSDFLSGMSHELRTPLNAILGFAQLLEAGSPPPSATQLTRLQHIIKAGWYLLELINEILDLALIESGKISLSREPVLLIDVMHECQAMMEPQAQKRGIQIHFRPFDQAWVVHADRTRLKQILINLLSNAIKYNREQGSVEVICRESAQEFIRIRIKDTGAGLPPEKLEQLFQPFNRLGQETGVVEGTGIGLVVTKQLVEMMGGAIGVESTVGEGSEFWVELLRDIKPQPDAANVKPADIVTTQVNAPLRTLLYVEDNPANLVLVEEIIADHPHVRLLSARDAELGIALARTHLPNVILFDINLPGINGLEALKILHDDPATRRIPVMALSANAMPRDIEKGLKAGFFRYFTKPIKINEFMDALDAALAFSEKNGEVR